MNRRRFLQGSASGAVLSSSASAAASDRIRVAEPIAVLPELRVFLQEQVPGQTLNELFAAGAGLEQQVEQAAAGLAKLHAVAWQPHWTPLDTYSLETEIAQPYECASDV